MSDADYIDDDYGDDFDGELSDDFEDDLDDVSPEVQAWLDANMGGTNQDQIRILYGKLNEQNVVVTQFWNEVSETTRRAWKNLLDTFGAFYNEHHGLIGASGSAIQNQIYALVAEYLRVKKLIDREVATAHQQAAAARANAARPTQTASRTVPVAPARSPTPANPARNAGGRRLSTLPATNAAFQNAASGFTVAKVLPWLLAAGVAWYVYTNRRSLFA